tara:strand:+ start:298 stop:654 length:357 start_codon:yes stop_codon:yes gene_type:complete
MGRIIVDELEIYAYHGCFAEEREIGSDYKLTIWVEGDFSSAEKSDNLKETVDYVEISDIAKNEMAISSKLIEHVADRILTKIFNKCPRALKAGLTIKKINPPMNVFANSVQYQLEKNR